MLSSRFSIMPISHSGHPRGRPYGLIKPDRMRVPIYPHRGHMPLRPAPACKARATTRWNNRYRNSSAAEIELVELVAYVAAKVPSDLPVQSRPRIPIVVRRRVGGNACRIRNAQKKGKYPGIVRIANIRQHAPQPVDLPGVRYSTDIAIGAGNRTRTRCVVVKVRKSKTHFF